MARSSEGKEATDEDNQRDPGMDLRDPHGPVPSCGDLGVGYLTPDRYGIMAALFAANAGTALLVGLVFGLSEFSRCTSRVLRRSVVFIGVASGFMSATFWVADEVNHIWLRAGIISPVLFILVVLLWFVDKVNEEGKSDDNE